MTSSNALIILILGLPNNANKLPSDINRIKIKDSWNIKPIINVM